MKKIVKAPLIASAVIASLAVVSGTPLVASAQGGNNYHYGSRYSDGNNWYNNWNYDGWFDNNNWYNNNNRRRVSDWEARNIAQRYLPGRYIVDQEDHWDSNGQHRRRYRFNDNHCVDVRDNGEVIRVFVIYPR